MTTLNLSKYLNKMTMEELKISLRSHDIELGEDEPQQKIKYVGLKSKVNMKAKAL